MLFLLPSAFFFKINFFKRLFHENQPSAKPEVSLVTLFPKVKQMDPDQADILSDLIWVQTVCKGHQQTTLLGKELISESMYS